MKIHFIGIGGIGMSAIAQFFLSEGHEISGSDLAPSKVTDLLTSKGIKIFFGHSTENLPDDAKLAIYTTAIDSKNPELEKARQLNIKTVSYAEALGMISSGKFTIAVAGTHGKTTTTAMIAKVMVDAGLSPTVIAGSILSDFGSNFFLGASQNFLVEACEYRRTFLHLNPNILVITNIEADHLDYYTDLSDIQNAFLELAKKLAKDDFLICNINDPNLELIIDNPKIECNIVDYHSLKAEMPSLKVPGRHNEENAKAALAVAAVFEISGEEAKKSLENFQGTWRRLERRGETDKGAIVYDDYAHHPTEIRASVLSLRETFPDKKIIVAFQPHLYSRTKFFLEEFGKSFDDVEEVIVAPIYGAREEIDSSVSNEKLAFEIRKRGQKSTAINDFGEIANYLLENFDNQYVIVTMGAGDIYKVTEKISAK